MVRDMDGQGTKNAIDLGVGTGRPHGTTRAEHGAQRKGGTHRGLRNEPDYIRIGARRGRPPGSNEHMDTRRGSRGKDPHHSYPPPPPHWGGGGLWGL